MAAYDIQKHFKGLRVDTGRRKSRRDPFADPFEDDSDDDNRNRRSRSKTKQQAPAAAEKEKPAPARGSKSTTSTNVVEKLRDTDDDFLDTPKLADRRPSPAPPQLASLRVSDGAGRRGSLDKGLQQGKAALGRGVQSGRTPRSAIAQAAGTLAYLDDSSSEDEEPPRPSAAQRYPSPAPRKQSDPPEPHHRSSTPSGAREASVSEETTAPPRHTVASPFAGTKYLEDSESDNDEEAVSSRSNSIEGALAPEAPPSPQKARLEVQRVDKPKQHGGGVSWRAFSAGRAEQRSSEIEALQASLRERGKSISFGTHAVTDDGNRIPIPITSEQIFAGVRGRRKGRGKSPPRRVDDTEPADDEMEPTGAAGGPVGIYDPREFKTNPFTGVPVRRTVSSPDSDAALERNGSPGSPHGSIPDIRVDNIIQ